MRELAELGFLHRILGGGRVQDERMQGVVGLDHAGMDRPRRQAGLAAEEERARRPVERAGQRLQVRRPTVQMLLRQCLTP